MIKAIIASLIFACLLLAISIKLYDESITHVTLSDSFLAFLSNVNDEFEGFRISIPKITDVDKIVQRPNTITINNAWDAIKYAYYELVSVKAIQVMINGFITLINVFIGCFNLSFL